MTADKKPPFSKPAGCFVQLVGAAIIIWGLSELIKTPPDILGAAFPFILGGAILLLGRKTK
jgi:hypothetical protein